MDHTTSHALPDVGSFSYSWPTSKPQPRPEERIGHGDITALVATDPASASQCSFDFRLSVSEQIEAMADADHMFLNGLLLPLHRGANQQCLCQEDGHAGHKEPMLTRSLSLDSSQRAIASATTSRRHRLTRPASQSSSPSNLLGGTVTIASAKGAVYRTSKLRLRLPSFGRRGRQHKCILFRFLAPMYHKMVRCIWKRKATEKAMGVSQRAEYGSATVKLCDLGQENAIKDAILHCKRSM
ncbi:hypothetical protein BS78_03G268700 [Paspalum vaginatum]|nr:hypothetical protein BS78_03G268700 [Paspalum vaginatum]